MSIKIKTISTVQLPPPKCRKNLFHVVLTRRRKLHIACGDFFTKATSALIPLRLLFRKGHAAPLLLACKCAHNASACYQFFAGTPYGA